MRRESIGAVHIIQTTIFLQEKIPLEHLLVGRTEFNDRVEDIHSDGTKN